jgi:hypothetical protein
VLANNAEAFLIYGEALNQEESGIAGWKPMEHDLALFYAIRDRGINFLAEIRNDEHY